MERFVRDAAEPTSRQRRAPEISGAVRVFQPLAAQVPSPQQVASQNLRMHMQGALETRADKIGLEQQQRHFHPPMYSPQDTSPQAPPEGQQQQQQLEEEENQEDDKENQQETGDSLYTYVAVAVVAIAIVSIAALYFSSSSSSKTPLPPVTRSSPPPVAPRAPGRPSSRMSASLGVL